MTLTEAQYRNAIVKLGLAQVGHDYRDSSVPTNWPPEQFDCSVFTNWLNHCTIGVDCDLGKLVPKGPEPEPRPWHKYRGYTLDQQAAARRLGAAVRFADIKPGDRLYYDKPGSHHVVMYIGSGKVVHAAGTAYGVIVSPVVGPGETGHGGKTLTMCVSATKFARAAGYKFAAAPTTPPVVVPKPPAGQPWLDPAYPRPGGKAPAFPGASAFGPGRKNDQILLWGARLVLLGFSRFYAGYVDRAWNAADDNATTAFQRLQGWSGSDADGVPGPETWKRVWSAPVPVRKYPRTLNPQGDVAMLVGCALVVLGYGPSYRIGPSRSWGQADHRALMAFQKAHGLPPTGQTDPVTWTRLGLN